MTCHNPFPNLNAVGEAFRLNGFRFPNDDEYVEEDPVSLGADPYKKVWPNAVWPSDIPSNVPLGFSLPFTVTRTSGVSSKEGADWDFSFPDNVSFLSGGTIGEDIAWFSSVEIEDGDAEFHRIFFSWNDLLSSDDFFEEPWCAEDVFNLRLGLVEPGVLPFSIHRQRTLTGYLTNTYTVGLSEFAFESALRSVELYGTPGGRISYNVGISTGTNEGDDNSDKDVYARISYKLGGLPYTGVPDVGADESIGDELPSPTLERSLTFGAFGYLGEPRVFDPTTVEEFDQDIHRMGAFAHVQLDRLDLQGNYVLGEDENAFNDPNLDDIASHAWFAQASYELYPWLHPTVRYEELNVENRTTDDIRRVVSSVSFLARANVRAAVEYRSYLGGHRGASDAADTLLIRFWFGF